MSIRVLTHWSAVDGNGFPDCRYKDGEIIDVFGLPRATCQVYIAGMNAAVKQVAS